MDGIELVLPAVVVEVVFAQVTERVLAELEAANGATSEPASPYLTVSEAAALLRAKPQRVYDLLSAGRLTRHKDGRRVLVSRSELDAHLAGSGSSRVALTLPPPLRSRMPKRLAS